MLDVIIILIFVVLTGLILYYTVKFSRKGMHFLQNINLRQDHLRKFVKLLFDENHEEIIDHCNKLKRSPDKFVQDNPEIFKDCGIEFDDVKDLQIPFKILLIHHLQLQDNFHTLDWKQSGYEGLDSINYLLSINEISTIPVTDKDGTKRGVHHKYLDHESEDLMPTQDLIIHISRKLNEFGSTLVEMNLGGDCYELFVVPTRKIAEVLGLANKLGIDLWNMK